MLPASSPRLRYGRFWHLALRFATATFALALLLYCGLRVYAINLAHRSLSLLEEASRIPIGVDEDSILTFVTRYGGVKWVPEAPSSVEDCADKARCEYENARRPDYQYQIALSPFNVMSSPKTQVGRLRYSLAALMIRTPSELRDPFSLRDWLVGVVISIRARRVVNVGGYVYVEGRNRWLGNDWNLAAEMPDLGIRSRAYAISGTFLTFPGHGGAGTLHYLTPAATPEQFKSAQSLNPHCITGLIPCRCLSDLTPLAFQYLSRHPDVGSSIETDDCPYRLNPH